MRYAVITRHRGEFDVRLMCRVLEVSPSGYYASRTRPPSWHALIDALLLAHVRIAYQASGETYGAPRVQQALQAEGLPVGPRLVARLVRAESPKRRRSDGFGSMQGSVPTKRLTWEYLQAGDAEVLAMFGLDDPIDPIDR